MGKHSKVSSSPKWRIGENVVLQKNSVTLTVVGQNNSRVVYTASFESCKPKRLVRRQNKIERKYVQELPNQFHCYNQSMGFVNRRDQNMAKYRIGIRMNKMVVVPVSFGNRCCFAGCVGIGYKSTTIQMHTCSVAAHHAIQTKNIKNMANLI